MSYRYDGNGGFTQDQPPAPQKKDSDLGSWLLIGIVLAFFYYPIRKKEFSALAETEAQA